LRARDVYRVDAVLIRPRGNTELTDYCPMPSPDGQYFFFSRRTAPGGDIYWMRASAIDRLRARP
jgi:hypothetical protein